MSESKLQGSDIIFVDGEWLFADTREPTIKTWMDRSCGHCRKPSIKDGAEAYDSCIGKVNGLMNACCGHGVIDDAYAQISESETLRGQDAIDYFELNRSENA